MNKAKGISKKLSKTELEKLGIELITDPAEFLRCVECGRHWSVKESFKRLPRDYWKCARGCNSG